MIRRFLKNKYLLATFILLFLLGIFFNQQIFNNRTLVPLDILNEFDLMLKDGSVSYNYLISDIVDQFYPNYNFAFQNIINGELPFWNPYVLTGVPFFADSQVSVFELTHLLSYVFKISPLSYHLFSAILLLFILGLSFFLYLKNLEFDSLVSMFGAVALMFSGTIIVWLNYPLMTSFIWLPLLLLCVDKIVLRKKHFFLFVLSLVVCLMLLAGYPQIALVNLIVIALYFIFRSFQNKKIDIKIIFLLIIFILLGIGMSAIQVGPSWDFIKRSESYEVGRGYFGQDSLVEVAKEQFSNFDNNLLTFSEKVKTYGVLAFSPEHYGSPVDRDYKNPENNPYANFSELAIYSGILTIILALFSVVFLRKEKAILFWLFSSVISFSLAANLPFLNLFKYLPLINKMSASRFRLIFIFSVVLLATYSLQRLFCFLKKKNLKFAKILVCSILIITFFDLFYFFGDYNLGVEKDDSFILDNQAVKFLQENTKEERVLGLGILSGGFKTSIIPNIGMMLNLYDVRGYNPIINKRYTSFADKYLTRRGSFVLADAVFSEKVLDMMGVKYLICQKGGCLTVRQEEDWDKKYEGDKVDIFQNPNFVPRAYISYDILKSESTTQSLEIIGSSNFDPYFNVVVDKNSFTGKIFDTHDDYSIKKADILKYSNNEVIIGTQSEKEGILVLTDAYGDGWTASVNGEEKNILLVNGIFRGVVVPAGESEVVFKYFPKNFHVYLFLSLFSFFCFVLCFLLFLKKYQKKF